MYDGVAEGRTGSEGCKMVMKARLVSYAKPVRGYVVKSNSGCARNEVDVNRQRG